MGDVRRSTGGAGGLSGGGPSTVGAGGSMRARDVSRPRPADLAAAERTLVVRRRPLDETAAQRKA